MRIFLSYGNDNYSKLAARIKHDLNERGHKVWFDVERLKPGKDWERYIEEGIEWVSGAADAGRFLLLLTPQSVRRPYGYCLNELSRAYARNLPIIPVMVSTVEPPLSICRLQWLDMRQCYPVEQHEVQYAKQFDQLVRALTEKQVPFEGVQQRLLNYLDPVTYGDELSRHLSRFTGREWVTLEVDRWLVSSRRMLWITGEAGVGKSALAAWLCEKRPEIAAYHFCRFGNSSRVDPGKALLSLAYQLSTQLSVYQDRLNASPLEKIVAEANPLAIFDRLFVDLLKDIAPPAEPQVLLIDALDEATQHGTNELASLIGRELDRLPSWLRAIVTSRPHEQEVNFALQALDPWKLDAGRPENLNDIRTYLRRELRPFATRGAPPATVVSTILDRSEGLFLYVTWVRDELHNGRLSLTNVQDFPRGLGGVYGDFFKRYFPDLSEYASRWRPVLELISVAREPLRLHDVAAVFGWEEYEILAVTARLGSLFPIVDGRLRPFHQSVRNWLTDFRRSGPYYVDAGAGEKRLSDFAWQQYQTGVDTMASYCVLHAPSHLAGCGRNTHLRRLLLDFSWIDAKFQSAGISGLLADYDLVQDAASSRLSTNKTAVPANVESMIGIPPWRVSTSSEGLSVSPMAKTVGAKSSDSLRLVQSALRLGAHVLSADKTQLPCQLYGRLATCAPELNRFRRGIEKEVRHQWLQPLRDGLTQAGGPLLRILSGHGAPVNSVAVTPDGKSAVSGSSDCTLVLWDLRTGRPKRIFRSHTQPVNGVAITPDGKYAVSASSDDTVKVWDLENVSPPRTFRDHTLPVHAVAVARDSECLVSGASDNTLKVWNIRALSRPRLTLTGHVSSVNAVAVAPDGRLISASSDHTVRVWDPVGYQLPCILEGHNQDVRSVAVTPDGHFAISVSRDCTLRIWDLATLRQSAVLTDNEGVQAVAVSPDGQTIVTVAHEKLKVWDLNARQLNRTFTGRGRLLGLAMTPDCRSVVTASSDHTLQVWDLKNEHGQKSEMRHTQQINALAVVPDGKHAISASSDKKLLVWDLSENSPPRTLVGHKHSVSSVAVTPDGKKAISGSYDDILIVWDLVDEYPYRTLVGHSQPVNAVAVTPDSRHVISASSDKTLILWDLETHRPKRTLEGHHEAVRAVAISPNGRKAISASYDNTLIVWDLKRERPPRILAGHTQPVTALVVTPDSNYVVSASSDHTLMVWDLRSELPPSILSGHSQPVTAVVATPDGKSIISASSDHSLLLWNLNSEGPPRFLATHGSSVRGLALTSNGKQVVSCSMDHTVRVCDLATLETLTFTADAPVLVCATVPHQDLILAGDQSGTIHTLKLKQPLRMARRID